MDHQKHYLGLILVILIGCRSPDTMRTGVGYRDEELQWDGGGAGATDYGGGTAWIEAEWYLNPRPMVVDLSTDTRLFLQGDRPASAPVEVTVEGDEPEKDMVEKAASFGKDADGNWTPWGVCALLILALFGYQYLMKKKATP